MSDAPAVRPGAVVVGATHGVGRAVAEELARSGWDLVVAARHDDELRGLAVDLHGTHGVTVTPIAVDLAGDDDVLSDFLAAADAALPRPDAVLIPAGTVAAVDEATTDAATTRSLVAVNMTGAMQVAGHYVDTMERAGRGTVVLISSIAAAAPRRRNVAYAAAKAGLESFGRSMQHRVARTDVAVQIYRLGYVATRLAEGQDMKLPPADPARVAHRIVSGLGGRSFTVHEPRYWGILTRVLRALPAPLYNRLDF